MEFFVNFLVKKLSSKISEKKNCIECVNVERQNDFQKDNINEKQSTLSRIYLFPLAERYGYPNINYFCIDRKWRVRFMLFEVEKKNSFKKFLLMRVLLIYSSYYIQRLLSNYCTFSGTDVIKFQKHKVILVKVYVKVFHFVA